MEKRLDLRIQKTYQALQNAFTQLLEEKNFEDITVNELCDKALIRRTTFYKHFADKYEYFKFYLSTLSESFKSQVTVTSLINDPVTYSVTMLHEMFQFVRTHKKLVDGLRNSNMMTFLYQALQEQFVKELREVFMTVNKRTSLMPQTELLITFYAGGLINVVYWWMNNPDTLDEEAIAELLVKSIALPKELLS